MDASLKIRIDDKSLSAFYETANKKKHSVNSLINDFVRLYLLDDGHSWATKIVVELNDDIPISTPLSSITDFIVLRTPLSQMDAKCKAYKQGRSQIIRAAINSYVKGAWMYY